MKHISILFSLLLISTPLHALTSNGKPFVEIAGQVHELENVVLSLEEQITEIVVAADTLEQQVINNSAAVANLQTQNSDLQTQIDAGVGDLIALQSEVDNNTLLIDTIQSSISDISNILATKQDILDGVCPEESALQEILPDGAIVCAPIGGSGLDIIRVSKVIQYNFNYFDRGSAIITTTISCPTGYTVISYGWEAINSSTTAKATATEGTLSKPINATTWKVRAIASALQSGIKPAQPALFIPIITCIR